MKRFSPLVLKAPAVCAASVLLACSLATGTALAASPNVATPSVQQIKDHARASGTTVEDEVRYAKKPAVKAPYDKPGDMTAGTKRSALAMLNDIRYVAGLDADVTLDARDGKLAQAAAYASAANEMLSHDPAKPKSMPTSVYNLGSEGASSSNLAMGELTLNAAILDWTDDGDSFNIDRLGHRRWLLNPTFGKTGFGAANGYYAIYAFDWSATGGQDYVAWPAQNMPIEWFGDCTPWSISTDEKLDSSKVSVVLTRERDDRKWTFSPGKNSNPDKEKYFNLNTEGYGQQSCVIFRPNDVSYKSGDVFDVSLTGVPTGSIDYKVRFFKLGIAKHMKKNSKTSLAKTSFSKFKVSKSGKKRVKTSWKLKGSTGKRVTGYCLYKSTKKHGAYKKCATTKKASLVLRKGLKSKRTYYFKVRGYKKSAGKTSWTKWSPVKRVKVK